MIDSPRCCFIPFIGWKFDASMHTSVRCIGEINRWIKQRIWPIFKLVTALPPVQIQLHSMFNKAPNSQQRHVMQPRQAGQRILLEVAGYRLLRARLRHLHRNWKLFMPAGASEDFFILRRRNWLIIIIIIIIITTKRKLETQGGGGRRALATDF